MIKVEVGKKYTSRHHDIVEAICRRHHMFLVITPVEARSWWVFEDGRFSKTADCGFDLVAEYIEEEGLDAE